MTLDKIHSQHPYFSQHDLLLMASVIFSLDLKLFLNHLEFMHVAWKTITKDSKTLELYIFSPNEEISTLKDS